MAVERLLLVEALLLFATLMAFMGGRIIAPAMAGYAQSEGRRLMLGYSLAWKAPS